MVDRTAAHSFGPAPLAWARGVLLTFGLALIGVLAALQQFHLGVESDNLWLMSCADKMLEGQTAYKDFLENSPPFAILLYMPPVLLARLFGAAEETTIVVYGLLVGALALGLAWRLIAKAGKQDVFGALTALGVAAAYALLPDFAFGQRDHLIFALLGPFLLILALRAAGALIWRFGAVAAGVLGALACAARPHYALALALPVLAALVRDGVKPTLRTPECIAATLAGALFAAASVALFPHYFTTMLPIALDVYAPDRSSALALILKPGVVAFAMIAAAAAAQRPSDAARRAGGVFWLAALGALIAYFVQGKGFDYHVYVAVALAGLSYAVRAQSEGFGWRGAMVAGGALALMLASQAWRDEPDLRTLMILLALSALLAGIARLARSDQPLRAALGALAPAFAAAGIGLATLGFHYAWFATPMFEDDVRALGPHPKIASLTNVSALAHPLVSKVGGVWTLSVIAQMISYDADRVLAAGHADAATRARLEADKLQDRDRFFHDIATDPPDALLVSETWASEHFQDDRLAPLLQTYRRQDAKTVTRQGRPETFALYVREGK